jgi:hypothetical protein
MQDFSIAEKCTEEEEKEEFIFKFLLFSALRLQLWNPPYCSFTEDKGHIIGTLINYGLMRICYVLQQDC